MGGGVLVAIAWTLNSIADSLPMLYVAAIFAGLGAGAVYGTCVGNALKWFADRRGLAAGLTAAGFGAGAAATVVPIIDTIQNYGYKSAFLWFGLVQGIVVLIVSQFLRAPQPGDVPLAPQNRLRQSARSYTWQEVLTTPLFYVMYIMFILVAAGGLMATAQLASIAADFGVAKTPMVVLGFAGTTLIVAGIFDNLMNGLARPFFGWVSDMIGREVTMCVVFLCGAASMYALSAFGHTPAGFVLFAACIYFTWGEIYSLFPSTCTDAFGTKFATTNAGMLYTAKGTAALLVPLANVLVSTTGDWKSVFWIAAIMDVIAAIMAIAVLKPMRASHHAALAASQPAPAE
jgi:OFA family oxalate/formate antiporter-like MFS transporter